MFSQVRIRAMNWFKRKKRTSGNQEIRNWDSGKSGDQEAGSPNPRITGSPEPGEFPNRRVSGTRHLAGAPGTVRSKRFFRLATPVLLALFTGILLIKTGVLQTAGGGALGLEVFYEVQAFFGGENS